jgi:uncharacterized RDD family membrane protein YckC
VKFPDYRLEEFIVQDSNDLQYAGFWVRFGAFLIDSLLWLMISLPLLYAVYGEQYFVSEQLSQGFFDILISWIAPVAAVLWFWIAKQATPGKMALRLRIVDASSGEAATPGQYVGRYFGYLLACIPLGLGLIWCAFDSRKQGWHDKLAKTVVVRRNTPTEVVFEKAA